MGRLMRETQIGLTIDRDMLIWTRVLLKLPGQYQYFKKFGQALYHIIHATIPLFYAIILKK